MGSLKDQFPKIFVLDPSPRALIAYRKSSGKLLDVFGRLPRLGVPNTQWIELCSMLHNYVFSEAPNRIVWDLDVNGVFSVSSSRKLFDSFLLTGSNIVTRWNNLIPIKVNILIWRIERDRIPTRLNLRDTGIDLHSLLCPICSQVGESSEHLFASCCLLMTMRRKIAIWWNVIIPCDFSVSFILNWADSLSFDKKNKTRFERVIATTFWVL